VIKSYELRHGTVKSGTVGIKYHVLLTTYETVTTGRGDFGVFSNVPRWEVLVVDEGQRRKRTSLYPRSSLYSSTVKSDASLLFKKLNDLSTVHRVIMTGVGLFVVKAYGVAQICADPIEQ
jgi:SNF2 family DNA or RNA helicase